MIKNNKGKLILSSIVLLLPMLFCLLSELLPEEITIHWGLNGQADGFVDPKAAFLIVPLVLLAVHWLCVILSAVIDKNNAQNKKLMRIVFWIIPAISLASCGSIFAIALGYTANVFTAVLLLLAVLFIVIGNYMPKTTRNFTMGIKIKWTLASDENWNATHRFSGKVYVVAGILCLPAIFLPETAFPFVAFGLILACVGLPLIYSYRLYKKQLAAGTLTKESMDEVLGKFTKNSKPIAIITIIIVAVILLVVAFLMFTGGVELMPGEESLTVEASFMTDLTLAYDEIDSVEYREGGVDGVRVYGYGSARLLIGQFKNDEFGFYTRYTYTGKLPAIVLTVGEQTVVLGTENAEETKEIYERLLAEISE